MIVFQLWRNVFDSLPDGFAATACVVVPPEFKAWNIVTHIRIKNRCFGFSAQKPTATSFGRFNVQVVYINGHPFRNDQMSSLD